jgi:2,3-diketo-5-methylthio-1-phosphopentane phosphatase
MKKTIILSDFDGTITTINVLDSLYEKFGGPGFRNHMERWRRGEISTMEEIELIFRTVKATRQDMETFLRTVDLDPGFKSLVNYCNNQDIPFAVISDGLRWYIDYILDFHDAGIPDVYAGDISFTSDGFRFDFPWYDPAYPLRSTAKPLIVKDYQQQGYSVIFIGDGLTDVEAAEVADVIYAKDVLLYEAGERGIQAQQFENMHDIYREL